MQWFQRISYLNGLNARIHVSCEQTDIWMDGRANGRVENWKPEILALSLKMALDLWDCLGKEKLVLQQNSWD